LETKLNLDPNSNPDLESDPELITDTDPNLQIIPDPAGSGCTTLEARLDILLTEMTKVGLENLLTERRNAERQGLRSC
jgi:hypothetical protein